MRRIILVGCGKAKRANPAPASDLYIGPLFRAARDYAEASGCQWFVLSGLHGLLDPDQSVAPYDHRIPGASETMRAWGERVCRAISERVGHGAEMEVEVLAGVMYAMPVREHAPGTWVVSTPLAGLELGHRLAWFKARRQERSVA